MSRLLTVLSIDYIANSRPDNYAYLFKPNIPFMKKSAQNPPFFGLNDRLPIALALLLGLQHSLAMLAGIITPPIIIAGYANFDDGTTQYLVSAALVSDYNISNPIVTNIIRL